MFTSRWYSFLSISSMPVFLIAFYALYRYSGCQILLQCLEELATKYPATKFVKIISTDCIPNYPDRNLPTVLVYKNGALKSNYVGLHNFGRRCTPEGMFSLCLSPTSFPCPSLSFYLFDALKSNI